MKSYSFPGAIRHWVTFWAALGSSLLFAQEMVGKIIAVDPAGHHFTVNALGEREGETHPEIINVDEFSRYNLSSGENICGTCKYRLPSESARQAFLGRLLGKQVIADVQCTSPNCIPHNLLSNIYIYEVSLKRLGFRVSDANTSGTLWVEAPFGKVTWTAPDLAGAHVSDCICRDVGQIDGHRTCDLQGTLRGNAYLLASAQVPASTQCATSCLEIFNDQWHACGTHLGSDPVSPH